MFQICDSEIVFSQYAQDPYERLPEMIYNEPPHCSQLTKEKSRSKRQRREKPSHKKQPTKSFVMSKLHRRGIKLIKISVIDLCNNNTSDSDSDSENVIINAQYIVKDAIDSVMDDTESLVKKISKSLIDSDF